MNRALLSNTSTNFNQLTLIRDRRAFSRWESITQESDIASSEGECQSLAGFGTTTENERSVSFVDLFLGQILKSSQRLRDDFKTCT